MPLQLNIFLLLFGGLQGLLVTLFFVRKKLYRKGYALLLIYFGVMLLQIVFKVMSKVWLMEHWNATYWISYQLPFFPSPALWPFPVFGKLSGEQTRLVRAWFEKW